MSGDDFDRKEDGLTVIDVVESGVPMLPAIREEAAPERRATTSVCQVPQAKQAKDQ